MPKKWQHRKCERCNTEYRPTREAQSYCSPKCRREAAYGRERFQSGTRGPRRRLLTPRLEASEGRVFTQQKHEPAKGVLPLFWFKIGDGLTCIGFNGPMA
jgi:hypothetical protein